MKIAFFMPTPFSLGGEQRVTSIISNILLEYGYDITIICTDSKTKEDHNRYKLDKRIKIIYMQEKSAKDRTKTIFWKILSQINRKTNIMKKNERIIEKIYYNRDRCYLNSLISIINNEKIDYVIGIGGKYSILLTFIKDKILSKIIGWQHSSFDAYFNTKEINYWHEDKMYEKRISELDKYIVLTESDKIKIDKKFNIESIVINNPKSFVSKEISDLTKNNFLAAGRFNYVKGYDLLIEAFSIFAQKNKNWTLTIVGEGEDKDKIIKLVKQLNLEDRVKIDGFTNDIKKYMLNSSVYLLSSRWEGMPMVVLEAYEMGLPIISFDIDAMKELTNGIQTGIIVEKYNVNKYAQAMEKLASDKEEIQRLANNARKKSEDYSYEKIGEKWKELLNNN